MTKEMKKGFQRYAHTQCEREKERMKERKAEKRPCKDSVAIHEEYSFTKAHLIVRFVFLIY